MVWVCEFQHKNESPWAHVVGTRREAIAQGIDYENRYGMIRVYTGEFDSLENGEYHIYKTTEYYYGA